MGKGGSLYSVMWCSDSACDGKLHSEQGVLCASCGCKESCVCVRVCLLAS